MPATSGARLHASPADWAACRKAIREGSQSFHTASLLLPKRVREPAFAIYAFCRDADDAVDSGARKRLAVAELQQRLDALYAGQPANSPTDRAFADTVRRFGLPKALPQALLEGLEWDDRGRAYETISEVYDYAARVASAVGAMMTLLMGVRSTEALARACDLGVAMQLSNIARDVGEDARMGRVYLPRAWLAEAGVDTEALLAKPAFSPELGAVVARLLGTAEWFYRRADPGIALLPAKCRPGIYAARLIYRDIGRAIAANGFDSVSDRAVVSRTRKLLLLGWAGLLTVGGPRPRRAREPALAETHFLLQAVASGPQPIAPEPGIRFWDLGGQIGQVVELFHELERRERLEETGDRP